MTQSNLEQLLCNFDVDVEALAICEVRRGRTLAGSPEDDIVVHYILAGTMFLAVDGAPPVPCPAGSIVVIPPGRTQLISADAAAAQAETAIGQATLARDGVLKIDAADGAPGDLRFACGTVSASVACFTALVGQPAGVVVETMAGLTFVDHAFGLMLQEVSAQSTGSRALASALMKSCLVLMIRRRLDRAAADPIQHGLPIAGLRRALTLVLDRPADPHNVASLAADAGMSRSSFAKAFVQAFQMTPMAFVATTRLQHAARLLRSTQAPVKSVAAAAGFSSRSHFSRAFRTAYGVDPSQFRKPPIS